MYISAATRSMDLARYIGEDLWIKVRVEESNAGMYFIKLLGTEQNQYGSTVYKYCYVSLARLSRGGVLYCTEDTKQRILEYCIHTSYPSSIRVIDPIDIRPTDELFVCN